MMKLSMYLPGLAMIMVGYCATPIDATSLGVPIGSDISLAQLDAQLDIQLGSGEDKKPAGPVSTAKQAAKWFGVSGSRPSPHQE